MSKFHWYQKNPHTIVNVRHEVYDELYMYVPHMSFVCIQEVKAKPGDLRPKMLENMALIASKQKQNVEKAVNNLMEVSANEVRGVNHGVC